MLERDLETGRFLPEKPLLVRAQRFRDHLEATRSSNTAQTYMMGAKKLDEYLEESEIELKDSPSGLLNNFVGWLSAKHLTPASIRANVIGAKRYIKWCRGQEEEIPEFDEPDIPKIPESEPFVLTTQELAVYFNDVQILQEPARTALLLLPFCGLRVSEICDLKNRIKRVKDDKGRDWTVFEVYGKGDKKRLVPLLPGGHRILMNYLTGWRMQKKSTWLFPGKGKKQLSPKTLQAHIRNIRLSSDLPDKLTPHAMRRTCFTRLSEMGLDAFVISEIAGHSNIQTTYKYYIKKNITDSLNKLNEAFE